MSKVVIGLSGGVDSSVAAYLLLKKGYEVIGVTFIFTEDFDLGLSEEDVTHLRLKWGKTYKPEEWVKLEQLYEDMMASYDI